MTEIIQGLLFILEVVAGMGVAFAVLFSLLVVVFGKGRV